MYLYQKYVLDKEISLISLMWQPREDVTYASIDLPADKGSRRTRAASDDDCEYAMVIVPKPLQPESASTSKDECDDDYVVMG